MTKATLRSTVRSRSGNESSSSALLVLFFVAASLSSNDQPRRYRAR